MGTMNPMIVAGATWLAVIAITLGYADRMSTYMHQAILSLDGGNGPSWVLSALDNANYVLPLSEGVTMVVAYASLVCVCAFLRWLKSFLWTCQS